MNDELVYGLCIHLDDNSCMLLLCTLSEPECKCRDLTSSEVSKRIQRAYIVSGEATLVHRSAAV